MKQNRGGASLAVLFRLLLDKKEPAIRPQLPLRTTMEKLQAFLPETILMCLDPEQVTGDGILSDGGNAVSGTAAGHRRGRPRREEDGETSAYVPLIFNAYRSANARRRAMVAVLKADPEGVLAEAEEKARDVLYAGDTPLFDHEQLMAVLTDSRCNPFRLKDQREEYPIQLRYYMGIAPEKAMARAILAVTLSEQSAECCEILFPPMDPASAESEVLMQHASLLSDRGQFRDAWNAYSQILKRKSSDSADATWRIGLMLLKGNGTRKDPAAAYTCFVQANAQCEDGIHAPSCYELYQLERTGRGTPDGVPDPRKAGDYLQKAYDGGDIRAIREMGNLYYALNISSDQEKAEGYYKEGALLGDTVCQRMLGRCLERRGRTAEAASWYRKAARSGDAEAAGLYAALSVSYPDSSSLASRVTASSRTGDICFYNADNAETRAYVSSLPEGYGVRALGEELRLPDITPESDFHLTFFLFDESTERNYIDLARIAGEMDRRGRNIPSFFENHAVVYLRWSGDRFTAMKMADTFAGQGAHPVIRLCNPCEDAARYLLGRAPLFLPMIRGGSRNLKLTVLGGGAMAERIILNAISVFPYTDMSESHTSPLTIRVVAPDAGAIMERLQEECPSLFENGDRESLRPRMEFKTAAEGALLAEALSGGVTVDREAQYYILAGEEDTANIRNAMILRRALLRESLTYEEYPFIAAYVRDPLMHAQAARFYAAEGEDGYAWYGTAGVFYFGSAGQLYTQKALDGDLTEERARMIFEKLYSSSGDREEMHREWTGKSGLREECRLTALSGIYRAFDAGAYLAHEDDYGDRNFEHYLRPMIEEKMEDETFLAQLLKGEHERWRYMKYAAGWSGTSPEDMQVYRKRGCPGRILPAAMLDPFLVDWKSIPGVQMRYNEIRRSEDPGWKDESISERAERFTALLPEVLGL